MLKITPSARTHETKLTFSLPVDHPAGQVSVVGNFNDWTPGRHRMIKRNNGTMSVSVTIPQDYIANFRYLGENGQWFDEPDADRIDSGASTVWPREPEAKPAKAVKAVTRAVTKAAAKVQHAIADQID